MRVSGTLDERSIRSGATFDIYVLDKRSVFQWIEAERHSTVRDPFSFRNH